ncbi:hypothetical protein FH063_004265 [Azospirillum argentinense]|uniref:Uncharacterized protein n=1 Tax=Azospirillum argentinense TaxID=2970906 RepID=A0A5B0KM59_9PROT|nr:hypothetical protein FH063_004265 [Azospirillum argentinense]
MTECEAHEYPLDAGNPAIVEEVRQELASEVGEHEAATLVHQAMDRALQDCPGCAAAQRD